MSAPSVRRRCAICQSPSAVEPVHLTYGVVLMLCEPHASIRYRTRDGGRAFARRLTEGWTAHGVLTRRRVRALAAHVRRVRATHESQDLPGSHAWRSERRECETRFARGEPIEQVIARIRDPGRWNGRPPPSIRTIRRWYADGRWLANPRSRHPSAMKLGRRALDALTVAMEIGTTYAWEDWISVHGAPSRAEQRIRNRLQRE